MPGTLGRNCKEGTAYRQRRSGRRRTSQTRRSRPASGPALGVTVAGRPCLQATQSMDDAQHAGMRFRPRGHCLHLRPGKRQGRAQLATEHVRFCALRFLESLHGAALNLVREQAGRHFQEVQEKGLVRRDHMLHVCRLVGVAQAGEVAAQELFHLLVCGCVLGASHGATGRLRRSGWQRRKIAAETPSRKQTQARQQAASQTLRLHVCHICLRAYVGPWGLHVHVVSWGLRCQKPGFVGGCLSNPGVCLGGCWS